MGGAAGQDDSDRGALGTGALLGSLYRHRETQVHIQTPTHADLGKKGDLLFRLKGNLMPPTDKGRGGGAEWRNGRIPGAVSVSFSVY